MTTYTPRVGSSIHDACVELARMATTAGQPVVMAFNEIEIVADPGVEPRDLVHTYADRLAAQTIAWEESPAGIASAKARAEEIVRRQATVDRLIAAFAVNWTVDQMITWLDELTEAADDIAVRFDRKALADTLLAAGYVENFGVGEPLPFFGKRRNLGLYIIGQAINCLRTGMPPHPVLRTFAERYRALIR